MYNETGSVVRGNSGGLVGRGLDVGQCAPPAKRVPAMCLILDDTEKTLSVLHDSINRLEERLGHLMTGPMPATVGSGDKDPEQVRPDSIRRMGQNRQSIHMAINHIQDILDRLEA